MCVTNSFVSLLCLEYGAYNRERYFLVTVVKYELLCALQGPNWCTTRSLLPSLVLSLVRMLSYVIFLSIHSYGIFLRMITSQFVYAEVPLTKYNSKNVLCTMKYSSVNEVTHSPTSRLWCRSPSSHFLSVTAARNTNFFCVYIFLRPFCCWCLHGSCWVS